MEIYKILTVFILSLGFVSTGETKLSRRPSREGRLKDLLRSLIKPDKTVMFVVEESNEDCWEVVKETKHPHLIIDVRRPIVGNQMYDYTFVICSDNLSWLKTTMKKLKKSKIYHKKNAPRSKYFLITKKRYFKKMTKIFFKQGITKLTVLQSRERKNFTKKLSGWQKLLRNSTVLPQIYAVYENVIKVPKIKKIIAVFHPQIQNKDPYYQTKFYPFYESVKIMASKLGDVPVGTAFTKNTFVSDYYTLYFHVTFTEKINSQDACGNFVTDKEVLFVPKAKQAKAIDSIIFVFSWTVLAILIFIFLFVTFLCWVLARILNEDVILRYFGSWMLITIQYVFGFPTSRLPRSHSLRIIIIFYIFYCLPVSFIYQCYMTSVLSDPEDAPEIKTIEELADTNLRIVIEPHIARLLKRVNMTTYRRMEHRIHIYNYNTTWTKFYTRAAEEGYVVNMDENIFPYAFPQLSEKFYPIDDHFKEPVSLGFHIGGGHYFFEKLKDMQARIIESGIQQKLFEDMRKKHSKPKQDNNATTSIYLEFQHLKEIFVFWLIGLALAAVALVCELFHFYGFKHFLLWLRLRYS